MICADQVVAPSPDVADVTLEKMSDLDALRRVCGAERMQVEAMAMHNAAIAMLRGDIGTAGIRKLLNASRAENDRVEARDRTTTAGRRALEARVAIR